MDLYRESFSVRSNLLAVLTVVHLASHVFFWFACVARGATLRYWTCASIHSRIGVVSLWARGLAGDENDLGVEGRPNNN